MLKSVDCEYLQVVLSQDGKRIWVCSPEGTVFRAKVTKHIFLYDHSERVNKDEQ